MSTSVLEFDLHKKQSQAFLSEANEILYGGAAGGGKSHLIRIAAIIWAAEISGLQVYLFRRIREDLVKNHVEGPRGFRALLAKWEAAGLVKIVEDEIRFWNGSKIYLCHVKDEKHRYKYQGAEIHVLLMDELTHFTEIIYRFLRGRVRMIGIDLPSKYKGMFPRIISGSNPGNIGHLWVKNMFIDNVEPMKIRQMPKEDGGTRRQFIPAQLDDNPSMLKDDPEYENKLFGLGSKALVDAMRWGDWNVIEGAFFDCWSTERHVIRPFEVPDDWTRFRAGDWGSAAPFSIGWYAIVPDDYEIDSGQVLPRGCLIKYREWYGCVKGKPNTGLKLSAEAVGDGTAIREAGETIAYGVMDPAAFAQDGGPSLVERMTKSGIYWRRADNARVSRRGAMGGWDQMRSRLVGDAEGRPMLVFFSTCTDSIRTIPVLQHDEANPEDLDTNMEDHAGDETRYACMSRPFVPQKDKPV